MSESMFIEAVSLARSGRKAEARKLLEQVLKIDRTNEMAWLWYAECVETPDERKHALEACLRINPQAQRVRMRLTALRRTGNLSSDPGLTQPVFIGDRNEDQPAKANRVLSDQDQWVLSGAANVFTISPDQIAPEEFARITERTEQFLLKNPDIKPVWSDAKSTPPTAMVYPFVLPEPFQPVEIAAPVEASADTSAGVTAGVTVEIFNGKNRGAVFTLLLVTLMFALLVGAAIMSQVV